MRFLIGSATASLLLAGAAVAIGTPAYAGDDFLFNHASGTMSASPEATDAQAPARTQPYMQIEPRDRKVATQSDIEGNNIFYNHAAGTMSGSAVDGGQSAGDQNARYTASYQQYMQMDPRDAHPAEKESDDNSSWFNHAEGTMSGN